MTRNVPSGTSVPSDLIVCRHDSEVIYSKKGTFLVDICFCPISRHLLCFRSLRSAILVWWLNVGLDQRSYSVLGPVSAWVGDRL